MKLREILHNGQFHAEGTRSRILYDLCFIADRAGRKHIDTKVNIIVAVGTLYLLLGV